MDRIYLKDGYESGTPIPKVIYWYLCQIGYKGAVTADLCNKLYNNELKQFFRKYPKELTNKCLITNIFTFETNITNEDINFYKDKIKIKKEDK